MHAGIANPRLRGKRSRHSRRMRNPQFYLSGKRPIYMPCYEFLGPGLLSKTHVNSPPPVDKIAAISQSNFSTTLLDENVIISIQISLKFVPTGPKVSIGSGNGLVPTRRETIVWTNADLVHWRIYAALWVWVIHFHVSNMAYDWLAAVHVLQTNQMPGLKIFVN